MRSVVCLDRGCLVNSMVYSVGSLASRGTGMIEPDGDLTVSVAIRAIEQQASYLVLGLGSGLVADSVLQDGRREYLLKGQFAGIS